MHVHRPRPLRTLAVIAVALATSACGGSGTNPSSPSPATGTNGTSTSPAGAASPSSSSPPRTSSDVPTAAGGSLDSDAFCTLLRDLHRQLDLTVVMVTHDLDTIFELSTQVAVVADKRIVIQAPPREVLAFDHPFVQDFFHGERGQRARAALDRPAP